MDMKFLLTFYFFCISQVQHLPDTTLEMLNNFIQPPKHDGPISSIFTYNYGEDGHMVFKKSVNCMETCVCIGLYFVENINIIKTY